MIQTGVYFDNIHSFYDLDLILSSVDIPPAEPKENYVDVPGADGSVDLTEAHGEVKFKDRNITFTFTMNPSGDLSEAAWTEKKTEVSNKLNGRTFKIILDKDDGFYWSGRCKVDNYKSDRRLRQITVVARVKPYKHKIAETVVKISLTSTQKTVNIINSRKSVCPFIECTGKTTIIFKSASFAMNAGVHRYLDIEFKDGVNQLEVSGTGTVTFRFLEGDL